MKGSRPPFVLQTVRVAGPRAKIRTGGLPDMKEGQQLYDVTRRCYAAVSVYITALYV
jgi:hypothetical protein